MHISPKEWCADERCVRWNGKKSGKRDNESQSTCER